MADFSLCCHPGDSSAHSSHPQTLTLATFRDDLLPKLISGEIRVKGAEKLAGGRGRLPAP
ncbi:MAG TPA: hypothetical protein HA349_05165 [Methanotrichaceae archaeon]|nr:hypothetical protein [Methanotrichaceae archaeon]